MSGAAAPAQAGRARRPGWAPRAAQTAILLGPVVAFASLGWHRRWVAEDAFIDLRVVRHLLDGHGPVFNVGERVEAYTSPLWVGVLAGAGALAEPARRLSGEAVPLEWIAVMMGLLFSAFGLGAATAAARLDAAGGGAPSGPALPLGAVVVAAIAASWDFATSGLETGLIAGWLGLSALLLSRVRGADGAAVWPAAVLLGLGPLVRPDLAIQAGTLLAALLLRTARGAARAALLVAAAALLPAAYQAFRMGYFAALVPNTAIAKEAGEAHWGQGLRYLADFVGTYWLWLPLGALFLLWLGDLARPVRAGRLTRVALLLLPVVGGTLHALYVVRVGGDFMHGRMLLPSLFALLLPVMAVPVRPSHRVVILLLAAVVLAWAGVCAVWLRPPYHRVGNGVGPLGIADERWFYVQLSGHPHPITLADYDRAVWKRNGDALRSLAERERALLALPPDEMRALRPDEHLLPLDDAVAARVVARVNNIGLLGYAAGPRVHVVDRLGLADPLAARLRLERRGRPGHEKDLPAEWVIARFAAPAARPGAASPSGSDGRVRAARAALRCGALQALLQAIEAPLGPERFRQNVAWSWRLTTLRIPGDPSAQADPCAADGER